MPEQGGKHKGFSMSFCANCGRQLSDQDNFCGTCGKPVGLEERTIKDSLLLEQELQRAKKQGVVFSNDGTELSSVPKTITGSFYVPHYVVKISDSAFSDCSGLVFVSIPDSVKEIGSCAFKGCSSLALVSIPDSVTKIGDCAFKGCTSLDYMWIPDDVTRIVDKAFCECTSLASVRIHDGVTEIGGRFICWLFQP